MDNNYLNPLDNTDSKPVNAYKFFDLGVETSGAVLTAEKFENYKNQVFSEQSNVERIYLQSGELPFYAYMKSHVRENRNKIIKSRKSEFISVIKEEVRRVLGSEIADSVIRQLKANDSLSTVQHHAPLGHPNTLNATLANALPYLGMNDPEYQNVLVLACAGVSFNNAQFPRGHLFHSFKDGLVSLDQFTFFGHTVDPRPVMYHHAYDYEDILKIKNLLAQSKREGEIGEEVYQKIVTIVDQIYGSPHALSLNDYADQITITNYWLFKEIFRDYKKNVPNLVYLAQENIALNLLTEYHLDNPTAIHKMIFEQEVLDLVEKYFNGIQGAFSKKTKEGTFLFWGMPKGQKLRVQLWRKGDFLEDEEGAFRVELKPEKIREAIKNKELIPSVMLTFSIIACYYGFMLGGGHFQTQYLNQMKDAYSKIMKKIGDEESLNALEGLITTNFVIPRPAMVYIKDGNKRIPATGLDMILYGKDINWAGLIEGTKRVKLKDVIERMFPRLINRDNLDPQFAQINERDIEELNGLARNLTEVIDLD